MDEQTQLPDKFRASLDPDDPGYEVFLTADKEQKRLAQKTRSPFSTNLRDAFRQKAWSAVHNILAPKEQQAEAWATLGRYDVAFALTQNPLYQKYWDAVWNENTCPHPHKYIKEYVWSVKEDKELPLIACSKCDVWNVGATELKSDSPHNGRTKGMSNAQALSYHKKNVK